MSPQAKVPRPAPRARPNKSRLLPRGDHHLENAGAAGGNLKRSRCTDALEKAKSPLRVKSYRQRHLRSMSEAGGEADVIGTKADIATHAAKLSRIAPPGRRAGPPGTISGRMTPRVPAEARSRCVGLPGLWAGFHRGLVADNKITKLDELMPWDYAQT